MMVSADQDSRRAGTIWSICLDEIAPAVTPQVPAVLSRIEIESAQELAETMGGDSLLEVRRRFELGRRCYAARVGNRLAAYGWVSFDEEFVGELKLRLRLHPDEAYIWDCATLPAYRQKYLYSALLVYIIQDLQKEHFSTAWIGADLDNIASQRGIAHAGFTHIADLVIARVLTLRQVWVEGQPDVPDHWVAEARRVFLNDREEVWLKARSVIIHR